MTADAPTNEQSTALSGLRVVDFSRFLPAAYVSWLFGDMGADIVRIEHPRELAKQATASGHGGDSDREARMRRAKATHARNKRSLLINPGSAAARKVLHKLIAESDVLIEDYRPGTLAAMGYSYDDMIKLNPRLIYVSVSFAGQTGPYSKRAGHDPAALALAGALSRLNGTSVPTMPGVQVADVLSGAHAAVGALMALQARDRTGRGQWVDVAMSDSAMPLIMLSLQRGLDSPKTARPTGAWHPKGGVWLCGDGEYVCTTDMETRYWRTFCELVDRPQYVEQQHAIDQHPTMEADLKAIFLTKPRDAWIEMFAAADTQAMPVLSVGEAMDNPHNIARGMVIEAQVEGETIRQIGTPFRLSETPGRLREVASAAGAHTQDILTELGLSSTEIEQLREEGAFDDRRRD